MTLAELIEAYVAEQRLERMRDYVTRGRPLARIDAESLSSRWVETYRAARALEDERREGELLDLRSEFDLRGIEPPMHLVAAECALFKERFQRQVRERPIDPAAIELTETKLTDLYTRLRAPKN
jgi:hypothetical protein